MAKADDCNIVPNSKNCDKKWVKKPQPRECINCPKRKKKS